MANRIYRTISFSDRTLFALEYISALTGKTKKSVVEDAINLYIEKNGLQKQIEDFIKLKEKQGGE